MNAAYLVEITTLAVAEYYRRPWKEVKHFPMVIYVLGTLMPKIEVAQILNISPSTVNDLCASWQHKQIETLTDAGKESIEIINVLKPSEAA